MVIIYVLGTFCSGKTYFADKLSKKLNLPVYSLDSVYWKKQGSIKASEKFRDKKLKEIVNKKSWIIEGCYGSDWINIIYEKADKVIFLDASRSKIFFRLFHRWKKWKFLSPKQIKRFFKQFKNSEKVNLFLKKSLNKNNITPIVLKNNPEINSFLRGEDKFFSKANT